MLYLWPQTNGITENLHSGFGVITGPANESISREIRAGRLWACDCGGFSGEIDLRYFFHFLRRLLPWRGRCLFVVVPDVYADALATLDWFRWYAWRIRVMGYPVAYVAQDGAECFPFPPFDWLFIGGTSEWKLSPAAYSCILRAKRAGRPVHVGRVNSLYRIGLFEAYGADSCDGTYPIHNPTEAKKRIGETIKYPMPLALRLAYRSVLDSDRYRESARGAGAGGDGGQCVPVDWSGSDSKRSAA